MIDVTTSGSSVQPLSLHSGANAVDLAEFRQIQMDIVGSCAAIGVLMSLLRGEDEPLGDLNGAGVALLLESVYQRLECAVDCVDVAGVALGLPRMH